MESKKINQLATELAPELSDLTIIGDPTTGISKKITLSQMASLFTGTVEEYASLSAFPLVGAADTIYIALDTNIIYRWNTSTSAYVELSPNIVTSLVFNDANGFDGTISLVGSTATLTITTALTTGSVGFIGASGALTQDNSNFFWDNSNKRLGINTNAPTTALDVFGSGIIGRVNGTSTNNAFLGFASAGSNKWSIGNVQSDHRFRIYSEANTSELVSVLQTGQFGIGIANPTTKLHIDGGASALITNLDADVSVAKSISFRSDNSARINLEVSGTESGSNAGANFYIRRYSDAGALIDTPLTITRSTGAATFSTQLFATSAYSNTSDVSLIISASIPAINFRTPNEGRFTIATNYSAPDTTNFLAGTGTNNPASNILFINHSTGFLGFGRSTASEKIDVNGNILANAGSSTAISVQNSGSIRAKLSMTGNEGDITLYSSSAVAKAYISAYYDSYISGKFVVGTNTASVAAMTIKEMGISGAPVLRFIGSVSGGDYMRTSWFSNAGSELAFMNVDGSSTMNFGTQASMPLSIYSAGTVRLTVTAGGTVCINRTTTPSNSYPFLVKAGPGDYIFRYYSPNETKGGDQYIGDSDGFFHWRNGNGDVWLTTTANTNWQTTSDKTLKTNFKLIDNALDKINLLNGYYYNPIDDLTVDRVGVIAQEVLEVLPEAVSKSFSKVHNREVLGVSYDDLIPLLINGIKELKEEIYVLKNK